MAVRLMSQLSRVALVTAMSAQLWTPSAQAAPLDLQFLPPQIDSQQICIARVPDEEMMGTWRNWSGGAILGDDATLMKRDLRRLMQIDAVEWFETLERGFARLRLIDPKYTENHLLLDRIEARLAAGRLNEVIEGRMVEQLAARAEGLSPRFLNAVATLSLIHI